MKYFDNSIVNKFDSEDNQENRNRLENLRQDFVNKFTIDKIEHLSLDEYIVGKQNRKSFCYLLETELKSLGDMHGSYATQFGVYYGIQGKDNEQKYRNTKKYGSDIKESFLNVKFEIIKLINNGKKQDIENIKSSKIAPNYRGKILSTYYPDIYLNIFSEEHLNYFLTKLEIKYSKKMGILDKQKRLLEIKQSHKLLSSWDVNKYSNFLYYSLGWPVKKDNKIEDLEDLSLINDLNNDIELLSKDSNTLNYKGFKQKPLPIAVNGTTIYPRDKKISKNALEMANFKCEIDKDHPSFLRKNNINYTEPHHLIPMKCQDDFDVSLDIEENIISLCSNCHNEIHYGINANELILKLYEKRKDLLKHAGLGLTIKQLCKIYE